jgi:hypothetical protein
MLPPAGALAGPSAPIAGAHHVGTRTHTPFAPVRCLPEPDRGYWKHEFHNNDETVNTDAEPAMRVDFSLQFRTLSK